MRKITLIGARYDHYSSVIDASRLERMRDALSPDCDRCIWHVSSTAAGGGVAEMLHVLLRYCIGAGLPTRWAIAEGDPRFFEITKRLCLRLYGSAGDGGPLGDAERAWYDAITEHNATGELERVAPGDVVVVHDPQPAGLIPRLRSRGARVIWRCHVGSDVANQHVEQAWAFLRADIEAADAFVFSTPVHVPAWLEGRPVSIVRPSIDPFAPKNAELQPGVVERILAAIGVGAGAADDVTVDLPDRRVHIRRRAQVIRAHGPIPSTERVVLQLSRWDRLKDMTGVLKAFARHVDAAATLVLAGPEVAGVADDAEGIAMFQEAHREWDALPASSRARVQLVCLPMEDLAENALMVNALQRRADIVVQKSVAEGFGLTVTEAMWKARPVVASAVGGIGDQIDDGQHGVLLDDPTDLTTCGAAIASLLDDEPRARTLGAAARERVRDRFLADRHLVEWAEVVRAVACERAPDD